ncbi:MAG: hypothetical protein ACYCWW_20360 [Deltaproteobacteria bacterium]
MPDCPLSLEALPPNLRKHVDPASAKPLRGMAAKALVPMGPPQLTTALFMLTFDPEAEIAEQARKTATGLTDRVLSAALRDGDLDPRVLDFFGRILDGKEAFLEWIILNPSALDETIAGIAATCSEKLCDLIGQNQLRLLRHEPLLRALLQNPHALRSTVDGVADFAVRAGVELTDVPALVEARRRVFGEVPAAAAPAVTAEDLVSEFAVGEDGAAPLEEGKRLTFMQKLLKLSVSQKIKLATLGNKEARTVLLRDSNKLVALAAVQSPRITDGEVLAIANSRTAHDEVLRCIYNNREWLKNYQLKLALVKNPKVPLPSAMRFLPLLRDSEIRELARSKNVPAGIQNQAKSMMAKKEAPKTGEH